MSCSSRPPDTHKSQESKHQQRTINADNLRWLLSTSFLFKLLYSAADGQDGVSEETWERESITLLSGSEMLSPLTRCVPLPGVRVHVCVLCEVYRPVNLEHAQVLLV